MEPVSLTSAVAELRQLFPNLADEIILQNVVTLLAAGEKKPAPATVSQVLAEVRAHYMRQEHRRVRAKKQADGTIHIKDTSTYRHYDTHWRRLEALHGHQQISEIDEEIIDLLAGEAQQSAYEKNLERDALRVNKGFAAREWSGGTSYNSALNAFSAVMAHAKKKKHIQQNFVIEMKKARKEPGTRMALTSQELKEIMVIVLEGGDDPELDYLLVWTLCETAGRRGGLINLRLGDLVEQNGIRFARLYEKGSKGRLQPISEDLNSALLTLARSRGAEKSDDAVFRYKLNSKGESRAITAKRFETLWSRIRAELPWAEDRGVSSHWLRHTTLTWIERAFSPAVARSYAGHGSLAVTDGYTKASSHEIIAAHSALVGGRFHENSSFKHPDKSLSHPRKTEDD